MALTNLDIYEAASDPIITQKLAVAIIDLVNDIGQQPTPDANELAWAKKAFSDPVAEARRLAPLVLIQNRAAANIAAVQNASDATYKTSVQNSIEVLKP